MHTIFVGSPHSFSPGTPTLAYFCRIEHWCRWPVTHSEMLCELQWLLSLIGKLAHPGSFADSDLIDIVEFYFGSSRAYTGSGQL